jgi:hypothetical protein
MRGDGGGGGCGVLANEHSCAHGAQMNFGDLTPYLTYDSGTPRSVENFAKKLLPGQQR